MNNNDIMQDPTRIIPVAFSTDANVSDIISFATSIGANSAGRGYSQLRRLDFLSTFVASDVTFTISTDPSFSNPSNLKYFDGADLTGPGPIGILAVSALDAISLPAPIFDSVVYMKITCVTPQPITATASINAIGTTLYDNGG